MNAQPSTRYLQQLISHYRCNMLSYRKLAPKYGHVFKECIPVKSRDNECTAIHKISSQKTRDRYKEYGCTGVTDLFTLCHFHNGATMCILALPRLSVFLSLGLPTCLQVPIWEKANEFHEIFYYGVLPRFVISILVKTVQQQQARY